MRMRFAALELQLHTALLLLLRWFTVAQTIAPGVRGKANRFDLRTLGRKRCVVSMGVRGEDAANSCSFVAIPSGTSDWQE
jgi:hypothetical protein